MSDGGVAADGNADCAEYSEMARLQAFVAECAVGDRCKVVESSASGVGTRHRPRLTASWPPLAPVLSLVGQVLPNCRNVEKAGATQPNRRWQKP